jgi:exodeoxyribonuclease VII large subunit
VAPRLRKELLSDRVARAGEKLQALWKMAELVHPERPLSRGFVRVTDGAGNTLTRAADALAARLLTLRFGDGEVPAIAGGSTPPQPKPRVERTPKRPYSTPQPGLFDQPEE